MYTSSQSEDSMQLKGFQRPRSLLRSWPTLRPLRVAGQSLDEEIVRLQDKWDQNIFLPASLSVVLACLEWYRWSFSLSPNPWLLTFIAIAVCLYSVWKTIEYKKSKRNLELGRDGERVVAEHLEQLRPLGYRVFHDVPGPTFNIDHVLIGPAGIFAVETKALRKPSFSNSRIIYDGVCIKAQGVRLDRDPLIQARAQARWLTDLINNGRKRSVPVRSVLLFPAWWVDDVAKPAKDATWVLNPKCLYAYLQRERHLLPDDSVDTVASLLAQYIQLSHELKST
jgi:hypothetical protein